MKQMTYLAVLCVLMCSTPITYAQRGIYRHGRLLKLVDLMPEISKTGCARKHAIFTGTITKVDNPDGSAEIIGFVLQMHDGRRESFSIQPNLESYLSNVDRSWFRRTIRPRRNVRITVYFCGSGGIPWVDVIEPLS